MKFIWIKKLNNPLYFSDWKILFLDSQEEVYGGNLWPLENSQLEWLAKNATFNVFWKDTLLVWASIPGESPSTASDFLSQRLWYNPQIKINKKPVYYLKNG